MAEKCKVVLSDLHLGAGRIAEGNTLEDFDRDEAFCALLRDLALESERRHTPMELILAGDTFEFLQVPCLPRGEAFDPTADYDAERYEASSEAASLQKLMLIAEGHPAFFAGLGAFIQAEDPRRTITFIKGNHDVNLHWESLQAAIRGLLGEDDATTDRVQFEGRCVSREGLYVEHGNQYCEGVSRFPDFEQPHDPDAVGELYLPIGSRWVTRVFNKLERRRYWLDGVKPMAALIWYLFALDFGLAVYALRLMLREAPSLVSGRLTADWDLMAHLEALQDLEKDLDNADRLQEVGSRLSGRGPFYANVARAMALYDGLLGDTGAPVGDGTEPAALPHALQAQRAVQERLGRVAERKGIEEGAQVVIFGHTHRPVAETLANGVRCFNSGTWTWMRDFPADDLAAWRRLFRNPERFTNQRRLNYVRVDYRDTGVGDTQIADARLLTYMGDETREAGLFAKLGSWVRHLVGRS